MIYISGRITGINLEVARANFKKAEKLFDNTVNPMKVAPYKKEKTWEDYMIETIKALFKCDSIYMLNNWKKSRGARIERGIAIEMGMTVIYQEKNNV